MILTLKQEIEGPTNQDLLNRIRELEKLNANLRLKIIKLGDATRADDRHRAGEES